MRIDSIYASSMYSRATPPPPKVGGTGFGSDALKVGGKIFAMLSSKSDLVVKLSPKRTAELVKAGLGKHFDPGHGRLMKS